MSNFKIVKAGEAVLYQKAMFVDNLQSEEIVTCATRLIETLNNYDGLAIAAPQIGISLRMILMDVPLKAPHARYAFSEDKNHEAFPSTVMINPSFTPLSEEKQYGWESCLSFPGYRGKVERYKAIKCDWQDLDGNKNTRNLSGFNAKVFQHEYDHLDGIVYVQRISDISTFSLI